MNQPPPPDRRYLGELPIILSLCLLVCACTWKITLTGRTLAGGDVFTYFYPYWAEATRAIRAGRLPLWNPYLFMGVPFLANSQVGFFYPLNWPLWLLFPAHRSVHLTIVLHLCLAALNAYLWGRTSLRLGRIGAWTVGALFALGGYLGAQVEHVNQLQGLAWLPLMLTLYDKGASLRGRKFAWAGLSSVVGLIVLAGHTQTTFITLVGLGFYALLPALISAFAARRSAQDGWWKPLARRALPLAAAVGLGIGLAAIQLAPTWELSRLSVRAEGLPFNERLSFSLSPLYLGHALLPRFAAPVPPQHIEHVAYIGLTGLLLTTLGLFTTLNPNPQPQTSTSTLNLKPQTSTSTSTLNLNPNPQPQPQPSTLLLLGLFFALGLYNPLYLLLARYVPGFAHFRAPARWLALYAIGAAGLAGHGAERLWRRQSSNRATCPITPLAIIPLLLMGWAAVSARLGAAEPIGWPTAVGWATGLLLGLGALALASRKPRLATLGLLASLTLELFAASSALPHTCATAPQALTQLRPSIAHLLSDAAGQEFDRGGGSGRFLSMSDITFDPGDLPEIELIYGPQLSQAELYDYIIAAKQKELLSPNLPLAFGLPAADGYDGGLLPLARYITLQRLILPPEQVSLDGRLRENLRAIPDGRWLSLFNIKHIITDKLQDAWLDDIFYDLQFGARLSRGEEATVAEVKRFEATALGLVSHLRGGATLPDGAPVGLVEVGFADGVRRTFTLRAGVHTAEELHGDETAHALASVGRERTDGKDYVTRLRWAEPAAPVSVTVRGRLSEGELIVRGMSLIDERTGGFQSLVISDRGRFRLAHSGDVKIYENLDLLPRAFIVHQAEAAADDEAALTLMEEPAFDPATTVVLAGNKVGQSGSQNITDSVRVTRYAPERVELEVTTDEPGYLILTDAWYPGWEATVDGEDEPILRADLLFRAVALKSGEHDIAFSFRPQSLRVGAAISLIGLIGLITFSAMSFLSDKNRRAWKPALNSQEI